MQGKYVRWLYDQLPELVTKGVLTEDSAAALRRHYGEPQSTDYRKVTVIVFAMLGAVLVGLGIILLFASNWENLSRPARAVLSLLPLLAAQAIAGYTLWKKNDSIAWREGSAAFLILTIGSSIALVSQTYSIMSDIEKFLIVWALLSLPVFYLLRSAIGLLGYMAIIVAWTICASDANSWWLEAGWPSYALYYIPLHIAAAPFVAWLAMQRARPVASFLAVAGGVLAVTLGLGFFLNAGRFTESQIFFFYLLWTAALYCLASYAYPKSNSILSRFLANVSGFALVIMLTVFTFTYGIWDDSSRDLFRAPRFFSSNVNWQVLVIGIGLAIAWCLSFVVILRQLKPARIILGALPLVYIACAGLGLATNETLPAIVANILMLAAGVDYIRQGITGKSLLAVNKGMGLVALLIICRFFDTDLDFVVRGIGFIVVGAAFFGVNALLVRKMRREEAQK
ncbi:MAG: DUF2157 domain-containing protein [Candidatus Brocadiia bacterium]